MAPSIQSAWLTVRGALLSDAEREWLRDTARAIAVQFADPLILNIGIYRGASMHCLRAGAPRAVLVGIDVGIRKVHEPETLRAELICKDSRHMSWRRPIHFLFVDGGHREPVVRSDIVTFGKYVVIGGMIAFHDYHRAETQDNKPRPAQTYYNRRKRPHPSRAMGVRIAVDDLCTTARGWERSACADSIQAFRKVNNAT